jgi:hypothetical protein
MLPRDRSSLINTQESTQEETQEIKWFGRAYSTGRQTTNKVTINQGNYKRLQEITRMLQLLEQTITLSLLSSLSLFYSLLSLSFIQGIQEGTTTSHELL